MKIKKIGKGYIKYYEDKPIKKVNQAPTWQSTTESGIPVILPEDQAEEWALKTGRLVTKKMKKYELDEL